MNIELDGRGCHGHETRRQKNPRAHARCLTADEANGEDKTIAVVVMDSKRRAYIIGTNLGQTNVYFFAADGRPIDALDIAVTSTSQSATLENYPFPANVVSLYNGTRATAQTLS
ncbi:MAG: pilus assembly protein N-terminal domain-containing protein [Beijerinckiaceae bacterium]|jgi:hypothetical protein